MVTFLAPSNINPHLSKNSTPPETSEGLDSKLTTNYYARMRFTTQLLTLLKAAPPQFTRVVSVFAPGGEAPLDFSNLDLKHKFSLKNASAYAITMTDFFFEELAKRNPTISFVHCLPGAVHTGFAKEAPLAVRAGLKAAVTLLVPLKVEINESGERHLYVSTSAAYPPLGGEAAGVEVGSEKVKKGSAGEVGSGAYLLGMHGEFRGKEKVLNELRAQNAGPKIWEHTMQTFTAVRG